MSKNEDAVPSKYPYSWSPDSDLPLQDFLMKYKPSMVQNDGTKPWIWVLRGSEPSQGDTGTQEATEEAEKLLKEVTDKVESIKNDASIPLRSSKKTGAKSKKEVREQVQAEATEKLKEIAIKHQFVSGKWLIFAAADKVDMIWSNVATSLVSGPLSSTPAWLAKVATSPQQDNPGYQHIICLYMPDIYDKDKVTEVMKILLRNHGLSPSGVKSNLYTAIGIDSKHASGIPSTTWKNSALLPETESKALKDAFFADLASNRPAVPDKSKSGAADSATAPTASKVKPKLKKKADDPFASDDDKDEEEETRKQEIQAKTAKPKPKPKKKAADDPFESDDDAKQAKEKPKQEVKIKKTASSAKRRQDSDDDDSEERPKKRNTGKTPN